MQLAPEYSKCFEKSFFSSTRCGNHYVQLSVHSGNNSITCPRSLGSFLSIPVPTVEIISKDWEGSQCMFQMFDFMSSISCFFTDIPSIHKHTHKYLLAYTPYTRVHANKGIHIMQARTRARAHADHRLFTGSFTHSFTYRHSREAVSFLSALSMSPVSD